MSPRVLSLGVSLLIGCTSAGPGSSSPAGSSAPEAEAEPAPTVAEPPDDDAATAEAAPTNDAASDEPTDEAEPAKEAEPEPLPAVEVKNIGMHIGGGPNDKAHKAPIADSVKPHMEAFQRCFAHVDDPAKGGDFGVDIRIEREGGLAKISHPRTSLKGEGFEECVIEVFSAIEFLKPKGGTTVVSYSLRFTPED